MSDLFIGGCNGKTATFYNIDDLAMWFLDQELPEDDPLWDYIEQLPTEK